MRLMILLTTILITSCSSVKYVNSFKELNLTQEQCSPTLPRQIKEKAKKMNIEDKRNFIDAANFYREKIKTICNLVEHHNDAHKKEG